MTSHELQTQRIRGILFVIGGGLLLLYSLGYIQKFGSTVLMILSLCLIVGGFIEAGFYRFFLPTNKPAQ